MDRLSGRRLPPPAICPGQLLDRWRSGHSGRLLCPAVTRPSSGTRSSIPSKPTDRSGRARAQAEGWAGEIEGLDLTLRLLGAKRDDTHRRTRRPVVDLGIPTPRTTGALRLVGARLANDHRAGSWSHRIKKLEQLRHGGGRSACRAAWRSHGAARPTVLLRSATELIVAGVAGGRRNQPCRCSMRAALGGAAESMGRLGLPLAAQGPDTERPRPGPGVHRALDA